MMKQLIFCLAILGSALSVSADDSRLKNDSALLKKINKLEERVDSHQHELVILKKKNAELSKRAVKDGKMRSSALQKTIVTRRGSKQVVFE